MIKGLITAALFGVGGAGLGVVGFLSANPRAFTHPVGELPSVVAQPKTATAPRSEETKSTIIELAEVRITSSRRVPEKPSVLPARLEPCSEWGDVGVIYVHAASATGVRSVRNLCDQSEDER